MFQTVIVQLVTWIQSLSGAAPNSTKTHASAPMEHVSISQSLDIASHLGWKGPFGAFGGQHKNNCLHLTARWGIYRKPLKQIQSSYVLSCTLFITFHLLLKAACAWARGHHAAGTRSRSFCFYLHLVTRLKSKVGLIRLKITLLPPQDEAIITVHITTVSMLLTPDK